MENRDNLRSALTGTLLGWWQTTGPRDRGPQLARESLDQPGQRESGFGGNTRHALRWRVFFFIPIWSKKLGHVIDR
jgi:hypothetical protein